MAVGKPALSTDPPLTGRSIGRFTVAEMIDHGGQGEVYRAEDTTLKRTVALKRVSPKLRHDLRARKRVLKEAERASALNSEHIAAIYDVLEQDDEVFIIMEYVEGVTLRERVTRGIETPELIDIAAQCADALTAAHRKHIIHGDIKPENIMLTSAGTVKVLDFGLAKRVAPDEAAPMDSTQSVALSGTPGYIAPEVLLAKAADARSDIFSLGVVLYEGLTHRHPFFGKNFFEAAERTLHDTPVPPHEITPNVTADFERIVTKMLAKNPDERYATSADLLVDLRALQQGGTAGVLPQPRARHWYRPVLRIVGLLVIILGLAVAIPDLQPIVHRWIYGPDLPERKNLVVLPFESLNNDSDSQAFARGVTDNLESSLAKVTLRHPLQVIRPDRGSSISTPDQARRQLGATMVLRGTCQFVRDQVRVIYSVVDPKTGQTLRGDVITRGAADPLGTQDEVVRSVLGNMELQLTAEDRQSLESRGTSQPKAYEFYLRGRGYLRDYHKAESIDRAIAEFNHALASDPDYTLANAGLGEAYWYRYDLTKSGEWLDRAQTYCQKAAGLGEGQTCLGLVATSRGQYEDAVREFQRALELDRTNDDAYRGLATAHERLGHIAEAEKIYQEAINLRPGYWAAYNWMGAFLNNQHRYPEAAAMFRQVTLLAPDNYRAYFNLGGVYVRLAQYENAINVLKQSIGIYPTPQAYNNLGTVYFCRRQFADAADAYERALKLDSNYRRAWANLGEVYYWTPGRRADAIERYRKAIALAEKDLGVNARDTNVLSVLGLYHAMLGERAAALKYRDESLRLPSNNPDIPYNAALVANQLGDTAGALRWLQQAMDLGQSPDYLRTSPYFDNLRSDKRFQQIWKRYRPQEP